MARRPAPGFVSGTSSEYLGLRPVRKVVRERSVVLILGPRGAGKSTVAVRIAGLDGARGVVLGPDALQEELVRRTRDGVWAPRVLDAPSLVIDGVQLLTARAAATRMLRELIATRCRADRRTVLVEAVSDGSGAALMDGVPAGCLATIGLRLPASRSGRMRFARRCCDDRGLSRSDAAGTDLIEPWSYAAVLDHLEHLRDARRAQQVAAR